MTHLVAGLDGMWVPCDCGARGDHDHPDMAGAGVSRAPTGNGVTPPAAEVIVSALVECVTGEALEPAS